MFVFLSPRTHEIVATFASYIEAVNYHTAHPRCERLDLPDLAKELSKLIGPPVEPYGESPTLPAR